MSHAQDKDVAKGADAAKGAAGTWKWSFDGPNGAIEVTLKLKQDGEKLTGTITGLNGNEIEIQDGSVKDDAISFKIVRQFNGQKATTTYTGTISGDSLKGKSETTFSRDFDAKRS